MIKLDWEGSGFDAKMREIAKQLPYAAKDAIAKVALLIQADQRAEMAKTFTIRKAAFMRNRVKVFKFPKVQERVIHAVVGIDSNVKGAKLLLAEMEQGRGSGRKDRTGVGGLVPGAVPIPITGTKARPAFRRGVPRSYWLISLHLRSLRARKGSQARIIGDKRTFMLPTKRGEMALMQRDRGGISPLYIFRNSVRLPMLLHFFRKAKALAEYALPVMFKRFMRKHLNGAH